MALLKYFQLKSRKQPLLWGFLPPMRALVNYWIQRADSGERSGTRGPYTVITPAQKFEVGRRATEIGTTAAIRYYAKNYPDLELKETSVRRFKNNYQAHL